MSRSTDLLLSGVLLLAFAIWVAVTNIAGLYASQLFAFAGLLVGIAGLIEGVFPELAPAAGEESA
ncbi:hypothetical protein [Halobacterium zhouii]|uniref:hypothetical protein n=1 Tax=Halobacterium zhouii TaxID=2902624 RepID=UPI001E6091C2|nr:hypothetical protein [Halobacterium zhouii]